jgi:hypothetical protein
MLDALLLVGALALFGWLVNKLVTQIREDYRKKKDV